MLQNIVIGLIILFFIVFVTFVLVTFFSKPSASKVIQVPSGKYYIMVKRGFVWDSLETKDEVTEYLPDGESSFSYPFNDFQTASDISGKIDAFLLNR